MATGVPETTQQLLLSAMPQVSKGSSAPPSAVDEPRPWGLGVGVLGSTIFRRLGCTRSWCRLVRTQPSKPPHGQKMRSCRSPVSRARGRASVRLLSRWSSISGRCRGSQGPGSSSVIQVHGIPWFRSAKSRGIYFHSTTGVLDAGR